MTMKKYVIDQSIYEKNKVLYPFALTDVLIETVSKSGGHLLHFWQLEDTMILGMKDTRVPHLSAGLAALNKAGYHPIVRNSGGLGVISDDGVLNVSLTLPIEENGEKRRIDDGYELMLALVRAAFPSGEISAYEIADSYCPGTYDLSIDGKKFAGIAQRRVKNGLSVMMYLSISGNQETRGMAVRDFYQASLEDQFGLDGYPPVNPNSMMNLPDLLHQKMTIEQAKRQLTAAFEKQYGSVERIHSSQFIEETVQQKDFERHLEKMLKRNELLKETK